ncbi:MAG TPA: four helix bundle protein [Candidatus Acidoferrum sp.]|nr:four helix bundle protein [Candidatus Acidoferrum sp.]
MRDFRELKVWQKAHALVLAAYRVTQGFPRIEVYGLTAQVRRACASIPANIVEGNGRGTDPEMIRFLQIALGSAAEADYFFLLAHDLGYIKAAEYEGLAAEVNAVSRMLTSFIQKLKANG